MKNEINTLSCLTQWQAGNVTSRKERHDMKCGKKGLKEKTHIKSNLWSINAVVCGLGLVREIDLIPWAWTPSIFCLQSIFMNPWGFSRMKHINNQCVRGWRSPNHCIQSERPALGPAQAQCIVGGKRSVHTEHSDTRWRPGVWRHSYCEETCAYIDGNSYFCNWRS